jgi:NTP pyrophosphatase (non-canonical NTP hydrolase)
MTNDTIAYYDQNAAAFIEGTANADMSYSRNLFLQYIRPGGRILDAGCGSGRDSLAFMEAGYQVDAFDASEEICRIASERLGFPVACKCFEDFEGETEYDGIWCCASLLHVKAVDLPDVIRRLKKMLRPDGALYVSFKKGSTERVKEGRYFNDMTSTSCENLLLENGFEVMELFESGDVREGREDEKWVNAVGKVANTENNYRGGMSTMKAETVKRILRFTEDRDWDQFHSPANLAKSIAIEAGELLECFQWSDTDYKLDDVRDELADVMVYCIDMLDKLGLDADEIINAKMDKNEAKYPVDKAKGSAKKYTDL